MSVGVLTTQGYDQRMARYAEVLVGSLEEKRKVALDKAILDAQSLDWSGLSTSERKIKLIQIQSALWLDTATGQTISALLRVQMRSMMREARANSVEAFALGSSSLYGDGDPRLEQFSQHAAMLFRTKRDMRHSVRVATGLASKDAIDAASLKDSLTKAWGIPTERNYWLTVASTWTGRARSAGQLHAFLDDGKTKGRIEAMLDERTSKICRFLHGKIVDLLASEARLAGLVVPDSVDETTFLQENPGLLPEDPNLELSKLAFGRGNKLIATLEEGADPEGGTFDLGTWTQYISDEELAAILGPPPYHLLCRSMIVPLDWPDELGMRADITIKETSP